MFNKRSDAVLVKDLPTIRRIMPYLMPSRTGSQVFYQQRIDAEALQEWLARRNEGVPEGRRVTLLHTFVAAAGRVVRLRPEVNRFISGFRTYQRSEISITFVVKRQFSDDGTIAEARVVLTGEETLEEIRDIVDAAINRARSRERSDDDKLVDFFANWPRPILRAVVGLIGWLDYHNAMPKALLDAIPLYTTVYLAPLGSIGLDAPLHHLYPYGSASVFMAIGAIHPQPVVAPDRSIVARDCLNIAYTLDERISDGFYLARTLGLFQKLMHFPWLLDAQNVTVADILSAGSDPQV